MRQVSNTRASIDNIVLWLQHNKLVQRSTGLMVNQTLQFKINYTPSLGLMISICILWEMKKGMTFQQSPNSET